MGDMKYIDTMIRDGLWDAFNGYHMGQTAENVAEKWQISRDMQDEFAVASQNKAEAAQNAGKFADEIVPVHHQDPQGRHRRWTGRIHPSRRNHGSHGQTAPGLHQGRLGHCGKRLGPERRRGRDPADVG